MTYRRFVASLAILVVPFVLALSIASGVQGVLHAEQPCGPQMPWNATCYRDHIPADLLASAPYTVIDPRRIVSAVTHLTLSAIYVTRLGSDDPNNDHPRGPMISARYVFGSPPISSGSGATHRSYLTVEEDNFAPPGHGGVFAGGGSLTDRIFFARHRMNLDVTTDGPRLWAVTVTRKITGIVHRQPVRPLPALRLYVRAPAAKMTVGTPATFYVLNNTAAAWKPADFFLVLKGRWSKPSTFSPYEGGACGGDRVPTLSRQDPSRWHINFGDCDEVGITATPRKPGSYSLTIRTYRLVLGANGMIVPGKRYPVRHGGFTWTGRAS